LTTRRHWGEKKKKKNKHKPPPKRQGVGKSPKNELHEEYLLLPGAVLGSRHWGGCGAKGEKFGRGAWRQKEENGKSSVRVRVAGERGFSVGDRTHFKWGGSMETFKAERKEKENALTM